MDTEKIERIIDKYDSQPGSAIQVLLEIEKEYHWIPREALERICEKLNVPMARLQHIATFYKAFSLLPRGRHEIHLCLGTACHIRGAMRVLEKVEEITGLRPGETDSRLRFSLETVNCLGCCALGPVMDIDGNTHGKLAPSSVAAVLEKYE